MTLGTDFKWPHLRVAEQDDLKNKKREQNQKSPAQFLEMNSQMLLLSHTFWHQLLGFLEESNIVKKWWDEKDSKYVLEFGTATSDCIRRWSKAMSLCDVFILSGKTTKFEKIFHISSSTIHST